MLPRSPVRRGLVAICAMSLLSGIGRAAAEESYYLLMFGSQTALHDPTEAHTFATFVKGRRENAAADVSIVEARTISWLPATLKIRGLALLPEVGRNLELIETLHFTQRVGARVSLWGPYEIRRELYDRAVRQIQLLESGQVRYKGVDLGCSTNVVSHCVHAVSSIADGHRMHVPRLCRGESASYEVLERFLPWIVDPARVHPWIVTVLRLDEHPIVHRDFEHPHSGPFSGITNKLLGRTRDHTPTYGRPTAK